MVAAVVVCFVVFVPVAVVRRVVCVAVAVERPVVTTDVVVRTWDAVPEAEVPLWEVPVDMLVEVGTSVPSGVDAGVVEVLFAVVVVTVSSFELPVGEEADSEAGSVTVVTISVEIVSVPVISGEVVSGASSVVYSVIMY